MKNRIKFLLVLSSIGIFCSSCVSSQVDEPILENEEPEQAESKVEGESILDNLVGTKSQKTSIYDKNKKSTFMDIYFQKEMPIFGYVSMPRAGALDNNGTHAHNPSFINPDTYTMYKDAGFNVVIPLYQREPNETIDIHRDIEVCNQVGIHYLLRDINYICESHAGTVEAPSQEYYKNLLETESQWYLNQPCVLGIQTKDEPSILDFDAMGHFYRALNEVDNTKWAFTTLFPSYANDVQLGTTEIEKTMSHFDAYKEYVRTFIENTNAAYVLFDYYINYIYRNPLTVEYTKDFMTSLSFFSNIAREYDIPFMPAIATYRHIAHRDMSPEEIEWTVNISLAYGAKGLEYYTYWPTIAGSTMESWKETSRMGLVTSNGIPHDTYYTVKRINKNIETVDEYLMQSNFKGINYFGERTVYIEPGDMISEEEKGCLNEISGGNAFVGVFEMNGKTLYYVVNNSHTVGLQNFIARFNGKHKIHILSSTIDKTMDSTYAAGFPLSAGQAVLLEVD